MLYTVKAAIPAGVDLRSRLIMDAKALSCDLYDSILLELATGCVITGRVFEDSNHNGISDSGETGWEGVTVILTDPGGELTILTGANGDFLFEVVSNISREIMEKTPAGMISITPDTVSAGILGAGDTIRVFFGDVAASSIFPVNRLSAPAGGIVDLAHTITAGTAGQASLDAGVPADWTVVFYRDLNQDGKLDGNDTRLTSADLALDPDLPGSDIVPAITRVFVPPSAQRETNLRLYLPCCRP